MFSRIVIGVDGAGGGADAMALARRLASPATELIAVSVAVLDPWPSPAVSLDYDRELREDAERRLDEVRAQDPDVVTEARAARSAAVGLHEAAARLAAGLIVIGSSRRGALGRILMGDDTRQTLRGAPCAVAVAPRDHAARDTPIRTIGLGWNDGPDGDAALTVAHELAEGLGAEVHALAVIPPAPWPVGAGGTTGAALAAETLMTRERLDALEGVDGTTVTGAPVDELARLAGEVDLMVVGSRGRGPLGRVLLGSTSEELAKRCVRPLLVVPRAGQPAVSRA